MSGLNQNSDNSNNPQRNSQYEERVSDPYRAREKWPELTGCPDCGAVVQHGRWQWGDVIATAQHVCPACQRIRDKVPAGQLILSGDFFNAHHQEILNLIQNVAAETKTEHPLERIMDVEEGGNQTVITFTGVHLTHGAGNALHRAYRGELHSRYTEENDLLRITWHR